MQGNVMVRYSDAELQEFKELIEKKLENATMEFDFLNDQISDLNDKNSDRDSDLMDDSSKQAEVELLHNMVFRQKQFIQNLENALIRIRNKTYGICSVTGQLIDKNRLKLVPHATKSIAGKNGESEAKIPTVTKKSKPSKSKPKTITKIIRKPAAPLNGNSPVSDDWEDNDDDDFDELDFIGINDDDIEDNDD